jgi:prepilin-type N-terminal cleavage/methylation domain-containing protein
MYKSQQKGFTLIELLVVIVIIGILASIVLLGVGTIQPAARDARRLSELRQVQTVLELYRRRCGFYPGRGNATDGPCGAAPVAFANISADTVPWTSLTASILSDESLGYRVFPNDPQPPRNYLYETDGIGTAYVLGAHLEESNSPLLKTSIGGETGDVAPLGGPVHCGGGAMFAEPDPNDPTMTIAVARPTYCLQF